MIRFVCFPRTEPPPEFIPPVVAVFSARSELISSIELTKGLTSDGVLAILRDDLVSLGFAIEASKNRADKIRRPVYFGENGVADRTYEIDGYHPDWRCGIEIEAGRGWMGNAVYRDMVQAMVMVGVQHLILAVCNTYKYQSGGKEMVSRDYENTVSVANALFGHSRIRMPYGLTVVGY